MTPETTPMEGLLAQLRAVGVKLALEDGGELRVAAPPGALTGALKEALRARKGELVELLRAGAGGAGQAQAPLVPDPAARGEPFPLTDLQHAYWLGRDSALQMGGVATHLYLEFDCPALDLARLETALRRMIDRHGMLRAVVEGSGLQRILPEVPAYRIDAVDCSGLPPEQGEQAAAATRQLLSHQVLEPARWPLFDIRATLLPQGRVRLHASLDLLILDALSMALFFREWARFYSDASWNPPALELSFRDYVLAERGAEGTAARQRAQAYWMDRVDHLPAAPELPLRAAPASAAPLRFSRREARLPRARWDRLKARARGRGLTPSCLLLAAYSAVLERWSAQPHFTVNVVVSNRQQVHGDVNQLLGDFASPLLHEVDLRDGGQSFQAFARALQQRFMADLEHHRFSGVAVLREWARRHGVAGQAVMPVVFSSGLARTGDEDVGDLAQFGAKVHSISQTSQVWLDHHVMEIQGGLSWNWDAVDAVFEAGVLDAMFGAYQGLLDELADGDAAWTRPATVPLPAPMLQRRALANQTAQQPPARRLHAGFVEQALKRPDAVAIVSAHRTLTCAQLLGESLSVADALLRRGAPAGQPVAVLMRKGWEQAVAVLGTLLAGAPYLPVDADLPPRRQRELLRLGGVSQVLVQPGVVDPCELESAGHAVHEVHAGASAALRPEHLATLDAELGALAYVIFTSGSTGEPKGVMIDHRGAANTVLHVNRLFGVGPDDRVLAVSSLSFDLSVYDLFGVLGAGGAVVLPDPRKGHDAAHWRALMQAHGVTLWNSAPQLMGMLMDSHPAGEAAPPAGLRLALLSGDFIPLDLPGRIRQRHPGAEVVALGGATEASVWSVYHRVGAVQPQWKSIPYGKPLPNQTVQVLDPALRPCPEQVKGRIFIGGIGLAMGYWADAEKTAARFIRHPRTGERLYDTGDIGHCDALGDVVIHGRDDGQVKLRGHRIELGEIEAVLRRHASVRQAVVLALGDKPENRHLVAYVEPADGAAFDKPTLKTHLAEHLPDYMLPRAFVPVDRMPVSANGKLDAHLLPPPADETEAAAGPVASRTAVEAQVMQVWAGLITQAPFGVTDNFFELGGDSIMATQLVRELNAALPPLRLEMHELFENLTVESLAALYERRTQPDEAAADPPDFETLDHAAMRADIEAVRAQLDQAIGTVSSCPHPHPYPLPQAGEGALTPSPPNTGERAGVRGGGGPPNVTAVLLTGATGWLGSHVLQALLSSTPARVHCLVRAGSPAEARLRVLDALRRNRIEVRAEWADRIEAVAGDLAAPRLGLSAQDWTRLAEGVDAVYHLAASVNVLQPYAAHRAVNVLALADLLRLAADHHAKPVFAASPMAVRRRRVEGRLQVLTEEAPSNDPRGLLTGYARSKWAAEQVLLAAARQFGLAVTVYRSSHALPAAGSGAAKPGDTHAAVLSTLCAAGVVPDWGDALWHGIPTDVLARLLVDASVAGPAQPGVVHIENADPPSVRAVAEMLLGHGAQHAPAVPVELWLSRCREAAAGLPDDGSRALASALFAARGTGAAVRDMFSAHRFEAARLCAHAGVACLTGLAPAAYWRRLGLSGLGPEQAGSGA